MPNNKPQFHLPKSLKSFILHLHPIKIDARAVKFNRTFGLGGIASLLFLILCFTGILLRFSYIPTIHDAYQSIERLEHYTIFGQFIRNLHILSSKLFITVSFLHLLRVYYSMAIYKKRADNWLIGLLLFFIVIAFNFTGYLLPWNQLSYWAITIFTQLLEYIPLIGKSIANAIRGGETINQTTLIHFYTLHTGVLPLIFICVMSIHFWLIRKNRGIALPEQEEKTKLVSVDPYLIYKEAMMACLVIAVLVFAAFFYSENLGEQANPMVTPNPTKAPWYFLGVQELLLHLHPVYAAFFIPLMVMIYFVGLPYFQHQKINTGVWFHSEKGKKVTIYTAVFSFIYTILLVFALEKLLHFSIWFKNFPSWISEGIIPILAYLLPIALFIYSLKKRLKLSLTELFISFTTVILSSYIALMLIAWFLRQEGMNLIV